MRYIDETLVASQFGWALPSQFECDSSGQCINSFYEVNPRGNLVALGNETAETDELYLAGFLGQLALLPSLPPARRDFPVLLTGSSAFTLLGVGVLPLTRIELIVDESYSDLVDPDIAELYDVSFARIADLPVQYVDGIAFLRLDLALNSIADYMEPVWLFSIVEDLLDRDLVSIADLAKAVDVVAKRLHFEDGLDLVNFCIDSSGHYLEGLWVA